MTVAEAQAARALRDLVRQTQASGAARRAVVLHMDRMPAALAKPHYHRLARAALSSLSGRDHAQSFELPRGRLAIVWRSRGQEEIEGILASVERLLGDVAQGASQSTHQGAIVLLGQLITIYDLPAQAPWLLDAAAEPELHDGRTAGAGLGLDAPLLNRLEESLAQADLSPFLRWRPVIDIEGAAPRLAWEERTICTAELAACLCPGRHLHEATWLFRRLARSIERRMLGLMTGPRELTGNRAFSLGVSVSSILSAAFLAFDAALPAALRGKIVLRLEAADILADTMSFSFARNYAFTRGYKVLVRADGPALLDHRGAGVDYTEVSLSPEIQADPGLLPDRARLVLAGVDDAAQLVWARAQGCLRVKGAMLSA
jgi:hypothetical protein